LQLFKEDMMPVTNTYYEVQKTFKNLNEELNIDICVGKYSDWDEALAAFNEAISKSTINILVSLIQVDITLKGMRIGISNDL
jgi:hypothetical protein